MIVVAIYCVFVIGLQVYTPLLYVVAPLRESAAGFVTLHHGLSIEKKTRPALLEMFRAIVANNRAGGWRRLKAAGRG